MDAKSIGDFVDTRPGKIRALGFSLFLMESVFFYLLVALVNLAFLCLYAKAT